VKGVSTPLNAIAGYADPLALGIGGKLSAEQQEYVDRIRRSQQHLLAIITDLLNFGRVEAMAGDLRVERRPGEGSLFTLSLPRAS
jgi:signal transduction histidine kinase